jgi:hypothetical protein
MKPTASSLTDGTKPGLARVTRTPALDAASTSMLRMSTAQRTMARSFGKLANTSAGTAVRRSATIRSASRAAPINAAGSSDSSDSCSSTSPASSSPRNAFSP